MPASAGAGPCSARPSPRSRSSCRLPRSIFVIRPRLSFRRLRSVPAAVKRACSACRVTSSSRSCASPACMCCLPMAMPQGHLVAFCTDLGFSRSIGALMLSVLLGTAFLSRQIWGVISDRIGGLATVLIGSAWQAASLAGFLFTQNETGLFTVAAAFGLGFSGIIPAWVLAVRELFPASEASWRIPTLLMFTGFGMAGGGWLAGLLYDHFGYLRAGLRGRRRRQSSQLAAGRRAGRAAALACGHARAARRTSERHLTRPRGAITSACGHGSVRSREQRRGSWLRRYLGPCVILTPSPAPASDPRSDRPHAPVPSRSG